MNHGNRGKGRKAGVPNKITKTVRENFERAFLLLQQDDAAKLEAWAKENPTEFYKLAAKLIPSELNLGINPGNLAERLLEARKVVGK